MRRKIMEKLYNRATVTGVKIQNAGPRQVLKNKENNWVTKEMMHKLVDITDNGEL